MSLRVDVVRAIIRHAIGLADSGVVDRPVIVPRRVVRVMLVVIDLGRQGECGGARMMGHREERRQDEEQRGDGGDERPPH